MYSWQPFQPRAPLRPPLPVSASVLREKRWIIKTEKRRQFDVNSWL
jgi:hypothetical protein